LTANNTLKVKIPVNFILKWCCFFATDITVFILISTIQF
jgi:hypothetical protein